MAYERKEYPLWSWSHSRRRMFQECPRMYFYQYYCSHNGWEDDAAEFTQASYRLKQLTNLPMEMGAAIHSAAAFAIQSARSGEKVPSYDDLYTRVRTALNQAYVESKDRAEWERWPNRRKMFHESYYDTGLSEKAIEQSRERIQSCLTNLVESRSFREAIAAPYVDVKEVESFGSFDIEGTPVYAEPDLVYRLGDDTWTVTDWKSGRQENPDREQMAVYALYVVDRHGVRAADIQARIEWLGTGTAEELSFSQDELDASRDGVLDSVSAMQKYLIDPDANRPRERSAFPLRDDTSQCHRYCKFYQLDKDEIASASPGPF